MCQRGSQIQHADDDDCTSLDDDDFANFLHHIFYICCSIVIVWVMNNRIYDIFLYLMWFNVLRLFGLKLSCNSYGFCFGAHII